jgi:hypothetical protein
MYKLFLFTILFLITITGCKNTALEGKWVQPIPDQPGKMQGINLQPDGQASSINMSTLLYDHWKRERDNLILNGKSIGNSQTISFSDTLIIKKLTEDSLILGKGRLDLRYYRLRDN